MSKGKSRQPANRSKETLVEKNMALRSTALTEQPANKKASTLR